MRYCLALDLKDDPQLIEDYEANHRHVWPEVLDNIRAHGIVGMEIYRLGTRLVMVMETDDAVYDADRMARSTQTNPIVRDWEALMWKFQAPTPWTPNGEKWIPMQQIFKLDDSKHQSGTPISDAVADTNGSNEASKLGGKRDSTA